MNNNDLKTLATQAIDLLAASVWGKSYPDLIVKLREVPIVFNYRMRTTGGICLYHRNVYTRHVISINIEINYEYATKRATSDELLNTIKHELAHAFQLLKTNDTGHNYEWKLIHLAMGGTAERCHNVAVKKNRVTRYVVLEMHTGRTLKLTTRTWNRVKNVKIFINGSFINAYNLKDTIVIGGDEVLKAAQRSA